MRQFEQSNINDDFAVLPSLEQQIKLVEKMKKTNQKEVETETIERLLNLKELDKLQRGI